jgi:hypothetical protein
MPRSHLNSSFSIQRHNHPLLLPTSLPRINQTIRRITDGQLAIHLRPSRKHHIAECQPSTTTQICRGKVSLKGIFHSSTRIMERHHLHLRTMAIVNRRRLKRIQAINSQCQDNLLNSSSSMRHSSMRNTLHNNIPSRHISILYNNLLILPLRIK